MRYETHLPRPSIFDTLSEKHPESATPVHRQTVGRQRPLMFRPVERSGRSTAGLALTIVLLFAGGGLGFLSFRLAPSIAGPAPALEPVPFAVARTVDPEPEPEESHAAEGPTVASLEAVPAPVSGTARREELPAPLPEPEPPPRAAPPPPVPSQQETSQPETPAIEPVPAAVADRGAVKVFSPDPEYPEAARLAGHSGTVVVEADVDASGGVSSTRVLRGISSELDQAARDALARWRFEPAVKGGQPATDVYRTAIRFELKPPAEEAPEPAVAAAENFEPPVRLFGSRPRYPPADWLAAVEGDVILQASISETGRVTDVEVLQGLTEGLDRAAIDALEGWRFRPATQQGRPVASDHVLTFRFAR